MLIIKAPTMENEEQFEATQAPDQVEAVEVATDVATDVVPETAVEDTHPGVQKPDPWEVPPATV